MTIEPFIPESDDPSIRERLSESMRERLVGITGALALALAVVTAFVPVVGDQIAATIGLVVGSPVLVVLVGLAGGLYGLLQLYRTGRSTNDASPLAGLEPERAHYAVTSVSGDDIDDSVAAVGGELPESNAKNWWTYREKRDVQSSLTELTVRVLASEHDVDREAAAKMVSDGSWTTDRRAGSFLGGQDAPELSFRIQFVDWLSGEAYQRRVEATVDVIARHAGVERASTESTDADGDGDDADSSVGASSRTAEGSALPVHELAEADRYDASGEITENDASSTASVDLGLDDTTANVDVEPDDASSNASVDVETDDSTGTTTATETTTTETTADTTTADTTTNAHEESQLVAETENGNRAGGDDG